MLVTKYFLHPPNTALSSYLAFHSYVFFTTVYTSEITVICKLTPPIALILVLQMEHHVQIKLESMQGLMDLFSDMLCSYDDSNRRDKEDDLLKKK